MSEPAIRRVSATEFKAHCLALMDEVERTRETIVITKRGREVARLVPAPAQTSWIGCMRDNPLFADDVDLTHPTLPGRDWIDHEAFPPSSTDDEGDGRA